MTDPQQKDTSMEAVAEATAGHGEYVTEEGRKVRVYKVTVAQHAVVLKVVRSVVSVIDEISGGAVSKGDMAKAQEAAGESVSSVDRLFVMAEDNMPLIIEIIENVTDLTKEEVEALSLADLFDLLVVAWKVNHSFFTKAVQAIQLLNGSSPEQPSEMKSISKSKRKRVRGK